MAAHRSINIDFFKKWSKDMAYVLGFFAADGYITINKRGGHFWSIQITDLELLKDIQNVIESNHTIGIRKVRTNEKLLYRLQIGSIEMCNDLQKLGYSERKTKTLVVPKVPRTFFADFVRGYFDGDGNVWTGTIHKGKNVWSLVIQTVFTSCSEVFLSDIKDTLETHGVERGVLRKGKGDFYRLVYSVHNSFKLYKFMYNGLGGSKLYLDRKKKVFEQYIREKGLKLRP